MKAGGEHVSPHGDKFSYIASPKAPHACVKMAYVKKKQLRGTKENSHKARQINSWHGNRQGNGRLHFMWLKWKSGELSFSAREMGNAHGVAHRHAYWRQHNVRNGICWFLLRGDNFDYQLRRRMWRQRSSFEKQRSRMAWNNFNQKIMRMKTSHMKSKTNIWNHISGTHSERRAPVSIAPR